MGNDFDTHVLVVMVVVDHVNGIGGLLGGRRTGRSTTTMDRTRPSWNGVHDTVFVTKVWFGGGNETNGVSLSGSL